MTAVHVRNWLAGTAILAIASNAVAAFAYDDRFPHLFSPVSAQVDQPETVAENVPIPRRAPHKANVRSASTAPSGVAPAAAAPILAAETPTLSPRPQPTPPQPIRAQPAWGPESPSLQQQATIAPPARPASPAPPTQIAAAPLSVPSPLAFAAHPETYGKGQPPAARVSSFADRFIFVVSVEPELASLSADRRVTAAIASEVPLPRPAPKQIRTLPISGAAMPFEPIAGDLSAIIEAKAKRHGVPLGLAHAVVQVESRYNPNVTGKGGTHGLMQIKHATARGMGYEGSVKGLYDPETNLEWGMRYLGTAHKLAKGDVCGTVMRYQGGHRTVRMSAIASRYCGKVHALLARRNAPPTTAVARTRPAPSAPVVAQVSLPAPPPAPTTQASLSFQ